MLFRSYSLIKILELCWNLDFTNINYLAEFKIDGYSLAKMLVDIGEEATSFHLLESLISHGNITEQSLLLLAQLLKKRKDYKQAIDYLILLEAKSPTVCIELAMLYEHRFKDLNNAFYYARKAYMMLHEESEFNTTLIAEVEKRITRLKGKLHKPN